MNLVKQRNEWRKEAIYGDFHSDVLQAYRTHRDREDWRSSETIEKLCEYILFLEERCEYLQENLDWHYANTGEE